MDNVYVFQDVDPRYQLEAHRFEESPSFISNPDLFLSAEEQKRLGEMTNPLRQQQYLQSRYWLKKHLAAHVSLPPAQIIFTHAGEGKPVLNPKVKNIDFNISHSADHCILGFSDQGDIGVDLEKLRCPQNAAAIAKRFFSPEESDFFNAETDPATKDFIFTRLWSGKESLIKAAAGGVFKDVHEVNLDPKTWTIRRLPVHYGPVSRWNLKYFDVIPGYVCSVAFRGSISGR